MNIQVALLPQRNAVERTPPALSPFCPNGTPWSVPLTPFALTPQRNAVERTPHALLPQRNAVERTPHALMPSRPLAHMPYLDSLISNFETYSPSASTDCLSSHEVSATAPG